MKEINEDSADTEELLSHAEERVFQILDNEGDTQSLEIRDILMDYIQATAVRLSLQVLTLVLLAIYVGWAVQILWR